MKLSVITINRNNAAGLRKTIESVVNQSAFDQIEYIVIDGASTDGSKEVIMEYADKLTHWVSEPDAGIYNAMNKGIRVATGDYCQFLNSGDWLVDSDVVENMLGKIGDCDILIGEKLHSNKKGRLISEKQNKEVSLLMFYLSTLNHTSAYIKRSLFDQYGLYDESLQIVSDWKWYMLVAGLNQANVTFADIPVSVFDSTGISSTNKELDKIERRKVLEELIPKPILIDYDKHYFDIIQIERLKKNPLIYRFVWLIERSLFKLEKLKSRMFFSKNL